MMSEEGFCPQDEIRKWHKSCEEREKKLVAALKDCAESLHRAVEDMQAAGETGWRVELRKERISIAESLLREMGVL